MPLPLRRRILSLVAALGALSLALPATAAERFITVASTTSTENSGLFKHLLPIFEASTGIEVRVVAVGTGQSFEIGRRGDADALLVHDSLGERAFVEEGAGVDRREIMYNDFVVVGPRADPAGVAEGGDAAAALRKIAEAKVPFASRGDDSGTHRAELRLWKAAGVEPDSRAGWYRALGSSMGATLNTAAGMDAYTLADRATWASFKNRGGLILLVEGDAKLFNQYGSLLVSPSRHPHVKADLAGAWHAWLSSSAGQASIAGFRIDGEPVFFPNYKGS